jgi:uncharacterized protein YjbI with pentapeptide repeats
MAFGKWWQREGRARGLYSPRLWPVWVVAPVWVAAACLLAWIIYLQLRAVAVPRPAPNGGPPFIDPLDVIKTTITVAGFVGAVLVGVYGYRKQRLVEGDAHRADAEQLAQRYTAAAEQLGHEKAAVRLAGVYARARLADDWDEQRQVCIDVLCAYLRMPYEDSPASEKYREGEREVRRTIIDVINDHLQNPDALTTWCGCDLDFTNATFDTGGFYRAKFTGGSVSFCGAKFGSAGFLGAEFVGGHVFFDGAEFVGAATFNGVKFTGGEVSFRGARFTGGLVYFSGARFAGGEVAFPGAEFAGSKVFFDRAKFTGGEVSFHGAGFVDGEVSFDRAEFTGGDVSFDGAKFSTDCNILWGPFERPAGAEGATRK